jgi:LacI family transcriptional regulator
MNKITIKEIAKLTGVSTATVSRVLNNNGRFSEETRKRVLKAAEKFDYRPNIVAKSLRTSLSKTIGVVIPDITNEFFASIVLAIENYCIPKGYSVFICNTSEDQEKEKMYINDIEAKGVDGLIYLSANNENPIDLTKYSFPVVCMDRIPYGENMVVVQSDNFSGGYQATTELLKQGCRNILLLRDERDMSAVINRFEGYRQALYDFGIALNLNLVKYSKVDVNFAKVTITQCVESGVIFDGIFAVTDWLALGALMALKEQNIMVPEDVKIVGFDNISLTQYTSPTLSSIDQDKMALGNLAAEALLDMINNQYDSSRSKHITVPVNLIRRDSTRIIKA